MTAFYKVKLCFGVVYLESKSNKKTLPNFNRKNKTFENSNEKFLIIRILIKNFVFRKIGKNVVFLEGILKLRRGCCREDKFQTFRGEGGKILGLFFWEGSWRVKMKYRKLPSYVSQNNSPRLPPSPSPHLLVRYFHGLISA